MDRRNGASSGRFRASCPVVRETAFDPPRLLISRDEVIQHIVERVFAIRPVLQKMADVKAHGFRRRADQTRCKVGLLKLEVPRMRGTLRGEETIADTGIDE